MEWDRDPGERTWRALALAIAAVMVVGYGTVLARLDPGAAVRRPPAACSFGSSASSTTTVAQPALPEDLSPFVPAGVPGLERVEESGDPNGVVDLDAAAEPRSSAMRKPAAVARFRRCGFRRGWVQWYASPDDQRVVTVRLFELGSVAAAVELVDDFSHFQLPATAHAISVAGHLDAVGFDDVLPGGHGRTAGVVFATGPLVVRETLVQRDGPVPQADVDALDVLVRTTLLDAATAAGVADLFRPS